MQEQPMLKFQNAGKLTFQFFEQISVPVKVKVLLSLTSYLTLLTVPFIPFYVLIIVDFGCSCICKFWINRLHNHSHICQN